MQFNGLVWSRMWQRIITAMIAGAGFLVVLVVGGTVYLALLAVIATVGYREFCQMIRIRMFSVESIIGFLYLWSIFLLIAAPDTSVDISAFTVTVGFLFAWLTWTVLSRNEVTFDTVAYLFAGAVYIGAGFAFMGLTRFLQDGLLLTLFIITVTWVSDSAAYFVGKRWGKRKLWPVISPNKTIEGSMAAVVSAGVVGILFWTFFNDSLSFANILVLSLVISIVGQLGDLIESALKRAHKVKDSGYLLPGHGGVLDRFDSLLFTFAFLHIFQLIG